MNTISILAMTSTLITGALVAIADETAPAENVPPGMKLVWSDEFNYEGAPDPEKWSFENGFARNEEDQWYQPDNARVEGGMLIIEARRERKANSTYQAGSNDWRTKRRWIDYTSSSLITRDKTANNGGAWTYGRFEMRGKIDIRQGMWPAFWTVGAERRMAGQRRNRHHGILSRQAAGEFGLGHQ